MNSRVAFVPKSNNLIVDRSGNSGPVKPEHRLQQRQARLESENKPPAPSEPEQYFSSDLLEVPPLPSDVVDIDEGDGENPQLMSDMIRDTYMYLGMVEEKLSIKEDYMSGYKVLSYKMRTILMDWLVQVHLKFKLLQETLYVTVAIIDRFLQTEEVPKKELQLVGVAAMMLASKFEEMYAPEIGDFVYITDNAYSKKQIREMERRIFARLDFMLGRPHALHFLRRFSKAFEVDTRKHMMAKYFLELSLLDPKLLHVRPSKIAAASLYLSSYAIDGEIDWDTSIEYHSNYSEAELEPVCIQIARSAANAKKSKYKATYSKYSSTRMMSVSTSDCLESPVIGQLISGVESLKIS